MVIWEQEITVKFERAYKKFEKKNPNELIVMMNHLST